MYHLLCFLRQCLKYFKERVSSELFRACKRGNQRPHRLPHYRDMLQLEADKSTLHNSRHLGGKTWPHKYVSFVERLHFALWSLSNIFKGFNDDFLWFCLWVVLDRKCNVIFYVFNFCNTSLPSQSCSVVVYEVPPFRKLSLLGLVKLAQSVLIGLPQKVRTMSSIQRWKSILAYSFFSTSTFVCLKKPKQRAFRIRVKKQRPDDMLTTNQAFPTFLHILGRNY